MAGINVTTPSQERLKRLVFYGCWAIGCVLVYLYGRDVVSFLARTLQSEAFGRIVTWPLRIIYAVAYWQKDQFHQTKDPLVWILLVIGLVITAIIIIVVTIIGLLIWGIIALFGWLLNISAIFRGLMVIAFGGMVGNAIWVLVLPLVWNVLKYALAGTIGVYAQRRYERRLMVELEVAMRGEVTARFRQPGQLILALICSVIAALMFIGQHQGWFSGGRP